MHCEKPLFWAWKLPIAHPYFPAMSNWKIYLDETSRVVSDAIANSQEVTSRAEAAVRNCEDMRASVGENHLVDDKLKPFVENFVQFTPQIGYRLNAVVDAVKNTIATYLAGDAEMAGVFSSRATDPANSPFGPLVGLPGIGTPAPAPLPCTAPPSAPAPSSAPPGPHFPPPSPTPGPSPVPPSPSAPPSSPPPAPAPTPPSPTAPPPSPAPATTPSPPILPSYPLPTPAARPNR